MKAGVERVIPVDEETATMPLFELQVDLEDGPTTGEWADLFRASTIIKAGDRSMMESEPVLVGSAVTWKVSQPSLPHAERFIRRRIDWANERFSADANRDHGVDQPLPPQAPPDKRETDAVRWFLDRHRQHSDGPRDNAPRSTAS